MEKEKAQTEVLTWFDLVGPCAGEPCYDDVYGLEALDARRAERDGWGAELFWDGR